MVILTRPMWLLVLVIIFIPENLTAGTQNSNPILLNALKKCQLKTGAKPADLEAIKMRKLPDSQEGLCLLECLFTDIKIIKNGQFNKQGMILAFSPVTKGDFGKINKLKELTEICDNEIGNGGKNCETAKMIVDCIAKHGNDYGLKVNIKH